MIYVFSSKLHGSKQLCSVAFSRDAIPTVQVRMGRLAARSTFIEAHQAVSSFTTPFVYFCEDVRMCNGRYHRFSISVDGLACFAGRPEEVYFRFTDRGAVFRPLHLHVNPATQKHTEDSDVLVITDKAMVLS